MYIYKEYQKIATITNKTHTDKIQRHSTQQKESDKLEKKSQQLEETKRNPKAYSSTNNPKH